MFEKTKIGIVGEGKLADLIINELERNSKYGYEIDTLTHENSIEQDYIIFAEEDNSKRIERLSLSMRVFDTPFCDISTYIDAMKEIAIKIYDVDDHQLDLIDSLLDDLAPYMPFNTVHDLSRALTNTLFENPLPDVADTLERCSLVQDDYPILFNYHQTPLIIASDDIEKTCFYAATSGNFNPLKIYGVTGMHNSLYKKIISKKVGVPEDSIELYTFGAEDKMSILRGQSKIKGKKIDSVISNDELVIFDFLRRKMFNGNKNLYKAIEARKLVETMVEAGEAHAARYCELSDGNHMYMTLPLKFGNDGESSIKNAGVYGDSIWNSWICKSENDVKRIHSTCVNFYNNF